MLDLAWWASVAVVAALAVYAAHRLFLNGAFCLTRRSGPAPSAPVADRCRS